MTNYTYAERSIRYPEGAQVSPQFIDNDTVEVGITLGRENEPVVMLSRLEFQSGPIPEYGVNGLTNEILIGVLVERIGRLNKMFPCRENSLAITKLEEANHWLNARTARRQAAGIEGKHEEQKPG